MQNVELRVTKIITCSNCKIETFLIRNEIEIFFLVEIQSDSDGSESNH